MSQSFDHLAG